MVRATRSSVTRSQAGGASSIATQGPAQLSSPPTTPAPHRDTPEVAAKVGSISKKLSSSKSSAAKPLPPTPKSAPKRKRTVPIKNEDVNQLPHNLGSIPDMTPVEADKENDSPAKSSKKSRKTPSPKKEDVKELVSKATTTSSTRPKTSKGKKSNNYGLTPGATPYPNWPHPTHEECKEVTHLLSSIHGEVKPPKTIPTPSLTVSGCGEVPSVLDALIRTRLSAATSGANSSRAFAGLVQKFGVLQEGVGKGSVDWNKVRLADIKDVFEAIKSGGLANVKSKDIKTILQMVWEENQARRQELVESGRTLGSSNESAGEKNAEVARAEEDVISLDHLHLLSNDDAMNALTKYPGIGPKTASCVLLFCLQRPSFAVDTHVFRLCTWLGWVPPPGDPAGLAPGSKGSFKGPTRESTYAHCEVRIPDDLKYPLHQLLIKHGKTCPRCRAITGENSEGWDEGCVIDHLVHRTGARKGNGAGPVKKAKVGKTTSKAWEEVEDESDGDSSELSDLGSIDEESEASSD